MVLCHPKHASSPPHPLRQNDLVLIHLVSSQNSSSLKYIPESSFVPRLRLRPVPSGVVSSPSREFFLELGLLFRPPFFVSSSPLTIGGLNNKNIYSDMISYRVSYVVELTGGAPGLKPGF